jgi:hypothetical protein
MVLGNSEVTADQTAAIFDFQKEEPNIDQFESKPGGRLQIQSFGSLTNGSRTRSVHSRDMIMNGATTILVHGIFEEHTAEGYVR